MMSISVRSVVTLVVLALGLISTGHGKSNAHPADKTPNFVFMLMDDVSSMPS